MNEFEKLGIKGPLLKAINEEKFASPSAIQRKSIPLVLKGKDVIAKSATGSGKTLAFGAAIINQNEKGKGIQSLILTPTRELAEQISKALRKFSKYKPLQIEAVYGGVAIDPQINNMRRADVVIGTPGRLIDHIERKTIDLSRVKILVLDEADRMLDMGFIEDVEYIIKQCSKKRQTMFFGATIPEDIASLSKRYMNSPMQVSAESYVDPAKLRQVYYDVQEKVKFSLLVHLLKKEQARLVMVFCNTKRTTDFIASNLRRSRINAQEIHGGLSQNRRTKTLSQFHSENVSVLVCTDVAARGLDIKGISHIYNYDLPKGSKQYIHRIGRTARAGKEGKAINLLSEKDYDNFSRIQHDFSIEIKKEALPAFEKVFMKRDERQSRGRGRFSSQRGSFRRGDRGRHRGKSRDSREGRKTFRKRTGKSAGRFTGHKRHGRHGQRDKRRRYNV